MKKILYIEDNEDNIFMLKTRLERKGYEVLIARAGLEGYDSARASLPDIILLDVGLPDIDGYETVKKIKNDPIIKEIPVIMLTAHAMAEDRAKAFKAGAEEYEPKPVDLQSLINKIEKLTEKRLLK